MIDTRFRLSLGSRALFGSLKFAIVAAFLLLSGCTAVGTGTRTIIRATCEPVEGAAGGCDEVVSKYPHLLVQKGLPSSAIPLVLGPDGTLLKNVSTADALAGFKTVQENEYQASGFPAAALSVSVRDRGTTPALLATDLSSAIFTTLSTAAAANNKPTWAAPLALKALLFALFRNAPDVQMAELPHHWDCGIQVYYYYPRISVDFGSSFFSPSPLDKFDFLAMEITLNSAQQTRNGDRVRIIDFNPKASDFIDYSRGQFTAAAQLQAQLAYLSSKGVSQVSGDVPDTTTTTRNTSIGPASGPQISGQVSDQYVSQLADSIERRTAAILGDGRTFYTDFRSIRQVRIGGTYNSTYTCRCLREQSESHAIRKTPRHASRIRFSVVPAWRATTHPCRSRRISLRTSRC